MSERFFRKTFDSVDFLIESVEKPKIKPGGSSDSNLLNRYFDALSRDISMLSTRANVLALKADRMDLGMASQANALNNILQALVSSVQAVSGLQSMFADLYTARFVDPSTTAHISHTFGQATLPVISSVDLWVQTDAYGTKYLTSDIQMSYAYGVNPGELDFKLVSDPEDFLKGDQIWISEPTSDFVWARFKTPLQYRGMPPTYFEVWPFPAFGVDIVSVRYQKFGDDVTWYPLDLSYMPGFDPNTGRVKLAGPVRIFTDNQPTTAFKILMKPVNNTPWGFHKVRAVYEEYESTANLVLKHPFGKPISNIVLKGRNPNAELPFLARSIVNDTVTIILASNSVTTTPVITGAILNV